MGKFDLYARARRAVVEAGFEPVPTAAAQIEARSILAKNSVPLAADARDLRGLNWSSIDNADSRDLDQVEYAEKGENNSIRLLVGIADVAHEVAINGAIDQRARLNTTSVYTPPATFLMLPEELSKNRTSLLEGEDRRSLVIDMLIAPEGNLLGTAIYPALLSNKARLNYDETGQFLEGGTHLNERFTAQPWLGPQIELQAEAARRLIALRKHAGALTFASSEPQVVKQNDEVINLTPIVRNRARDLIESFMIAANIASAEFLKSRGWPIVDRVVTVPRRWDRIREIATQYGTKLPLAPDHKALSAFLAEQRQTNSEQFADLSLAIVKLLGAGEYVIEYPDGSQQGHFGLAVDDYSHATAPNRRFADLLLQRLLRACLAGAALPYSKGDLEEIAAHCTEREHAARKVERLMGKVVAALLLQPKIGRYFHGVVTGASVKGTYARFLDFPAEGKIIRGERGLDVGDKIELKLVRADPEQGFIDLEAS